jgi:predicted transcriptional regulator
MADGTTKTDKSTTVRIYEKTKERLQKVVRKKAAREDRDVTEVELADQAVAEYLNKEEKKLGIA